MAQAKESSGKDRRLSVVVSGLGAISAGAIGTAALVALSVGISVMQSAKAADFSHVKHIFVPPSRIPRRFDYESQGGGREAPYYDASQGSTAEYIPPVPSSSSSKSKPSKYGMVPPPPPVSPSLLPSSLSIPPPPPAPSIIRSTQSNTPPISSFAASPSNPSAFGAPQRNSWQSSIQSTQDRSNHSPAVSSVLDRASGKVESLIQQGKLTEAQDLVKQYMVAFPKDKGLASQMVRATVEKAKGMLDADPEGAAKQAREALYIDGSNQAATTILAQALTKSGVDPKSSQARVKAGDSLAAQGRNAEAEVEYRAAIKLKSTTEGHIGLGNVLFKEGKKEQAKAQYQSALELDPDSPTALRQMGIVRLASNDVVGANANLSRALVLDPTDRIAGKNLLELWQRQVSRNPKDANAHLGLARAYQLTGDLKSAQAAYRTVVHLDPQHPNLPAARHSFKLALARQEAHKAYEAAKTLEGHGAIREAFDRMVEAVGLFPAELSYRLYQAELAEKLGMFQQAHDYYVLVLKEDPKNETAARRLKGLPSIGANGQPQAMMATAGSLAALQATSPSQLLEAPPAPTIAPPPVNLSLGAPTALTPKTAGDTNVNSIAGFLGQLRNLSLVQQQQIKAQENTAQSAIKDLTAKLSPTPPAAASSSVDVPPINIPGLGTIPGIGGTTASAAPAAAAAASDAPATPSMTGLALAPLLSGNDKAGLAAMAAQAAPGLLSGKLDKLNQNDMDSVYSLLKGPIGKKLGIKTAPPQAVNASSEAPPTAPAAQASALTVTPDQLNYAMQRLGHLEARNNDLQAQLTQAHQAIHELKTKSTAPQTVAAAPMAATPPTTAFGTSTAPMVFGATTPSTTSAPLFGTPGTTPFGAMPTAPPGFGSTPTKPLFGSSETAPFGAMPTQPAAVNPSSKIFVPGGSSSGSTSYAPGVAQPVFQTETPQYATASSLPEPAPVPVSPATPPNLRNSANSFQQNMNVASGANLGVVKMELEGVNASMTDIKLKVILRNEQDQALAIPQSAQAVVRMSGRPDRKAKVTFPAASIPPHSMIRGIIKVSGHDLNPSADVFIPFETASGNNEVHLTVPISSL